MNNQYFLSVYFIALWQFGTKFSFIEHTLNVIQSQ